MGLILLGGCTGIGLGEGGGGGIPNLKPPPPPDISAEVFWGELSGSVRFDPEFLHQAFLSIEDSPGTTTRMMSGIARDRAFHRSLKVRVHGKKGRHVAEVHEDGSFHVGRIRDGTYRITVRAPSRDLASASYTVDGKSRLVVRILIHGPDLADLDRDRDTDELVVSREFDYRSDRVEYRRVLPPGGDPRTTLPDGTLEILGPDGWVKSFRPDGTIEYRYDPRNLLVDQGLEPEVDPKSRRPWSRQDRPRPSGSSRDPLRDALEGRGRHPLVLGVTRSVVGGAEGATPAPGDLLRFEIRTDDQGGAPVKTVRIRSVSGTGETRRLVAHDDGGRMDRSGSWPGLQSSLDEEAGDGVFSMTIPVDPEIHRILESNHMVVEAVNTEERVSRPLSHHVHLPRAGPMPARETPLPGLIRVARLVPLAGAPPRLHRAELVLLVRAPREVSAVLLGPGGFKKLLFVEQAGLGYSGATRLASEPQALEPGKRYRLVVSRREGDVYYAEFDVR